MPRKKSSAGPPPPAAPPSVSFGPSAFSSIVLDAPFFTADLLRPKPIPPISNTPLAPWGPGVDLDRPAPDGPPGVVADSHGALAMWLLNTLGGCLSLLPENRPWDTRRCLQLLCALHSRGQPPGWWWHLVLALPTEQLQDVVERARVAQALVGDDDVRPGVDGLST